ncbi:hypothetical protein BP6252_12047 [Coleophoma cylindrospora]|uniref:BZIP domain-containing protein n=1 Tax=Coleophoma cylindrospora TaxID=1849047 RepID=A0A3D8QGW9_9HELO|nr:hypothetical protein BP6252_12047 [Coleophoma cylindrospora]
MSAYNGRRGPNVSEYIANLNAIPSAQDLANQQDYANLDEDLAMFTNTQFFDFDLGQDTDFSADFNATQREEGAPAEELDGDVKPLDFIQGDFSFTDFNAFAQPPSFDLDGMPQLPTMEPVVAASSASSSSPAASEEQTPAPANELKRKASTIEESSRAAAEEDKRRRNTAASARFRVKKKQREAALERSAKEMSDKVAALEGRINLLETENKWLKNLIVEKNENKDDIAALWLKYTQDQELERSSSERKDGVGTSA